MPQKVKTKPRIAIRAPAALGRTLARSSLLLAGANPPTAPSYSSICIYNMALIAFDQWNPNYEVMVKNNPEWVK
ncbi:hypothetical protein B0E43_14840 [Algoriphagus sp. A40]|nr:hypothetical protein B0E43_14840 [Algoriphagus sp. A40]